VLDVDALLAARPGPEPCGPVLEFDQVKDLELLATGTPERRNGEKIIVPAAEPNWLQVRERALELFRLTRDLRVAVLLTRALVRTTHLAGLSEGLGLVHAMLERYWDSVNPPLAWQGEDIRYQRMNALGLMTDGAGLLRDVRAALLVTGGPLLRLGVRDVLVAFGKQKPAADEKPRSLAEIAAALAAAAAKDPAQLLAVGSAIGHVKGIQRILLAQDDGQPGASLADLVGLLQSLAPACEAALASVAAPDTAGAAPSAPGIAPGTAPNIASGIAPDTAPVFLSGDIRTREEAIRLLDTLCAFFERTEPGNPAPLFIRRAQRMLNKSFVDIIRELAPDSLNRIEDIAGIKKT
jgi:type VI secretion system protein ImpA